MRSRLILGVLVVLLGACAKAPDIHSPESEYYREQEAQVLIDLFDEVIARNEYILPPPPPPNAPSQAMPDTTFYEVYIADSLDSFKTHWQAYGLHYAKSTADFDLVIRLTDSITKSTILPVKLADAIRRRNFHVGPPIHTRPKSKPRTWVSISRISFNRSFTKACFLLDCAGGMMLFAQKINGRWNITQQDLIWVE